MRNKILYIYTENLNFFYRLNRELKRLNIKFTILNTRARFPNNNSLILTTLKEIELCRISNKNLIVLPYSQNQNFKSYVLRVLAAYRIGYRENYKKLTFSVDPGSKCIGVVVFLDNYYLISYTTYVKQHFFRIVMDVVKSFKKNSSSTMDLEFKLGSGVLPITIELVEGLYKLFTNENCIKIYLVDESKSSKLKLHEKKRGITKHEISALVLALRSGIEVSKSNYFKTFRQIRVESSNIIKKSEKNAKEFNNTSTGLKDIIKRILDNEISLIESYELIRKAKSI